MTVTGSYWYARKINLGMILYYEYVTDSYIQRDQSNGASDSLTHGPTGNGLGNCETLVTLAS